MCSEARVASFSIHQRRFESGRCTYAWLLLVLLCTGCATMAPVDETRLFSKAFTAVDGASQPLLDDLAAAERRQGRDNAKTKAEKNKYTGDCQGILWAESGFIEGFCVADAS
jgi:hypothetical protein